ncbi:YciI family protein [Staphylococcus pseudoxylosus]|nr:YciI family protein [Staphylococcus pseudoxylosus]MEB6060860.1 YciI family protein [Staphylococcus pseudoxylosus]
MKYYIVKYVHKDLFGWKKHLEAHVNYLNNQVQNGNLIASGPIENNLDNQNEAFLIFSIYDKSSLTKLLEKDPFWQQGLVDEYTIDLWEPRFGNLDNLKIE